MFKLLQLTLRMRTLKERIIIETFSEYMRFNYVVKGYASKIILSFSGFN